MYVDLEADSTGDLVEGLAVQGAGFGVQYKVREITRAPVHLHTCSPVSSFVINGHGAAAAFSSEPEELMALFSLEGAL